MRTKNIAYYEARIAFGMASLLPLMLLPGYMFLGWILWTSRQETPSLHQITTVFELVLALSGGLACAHLMTIEREEGFDEIRRTYTEPAWRIPVIRTLEGLAFIALSGLLAAACFYLVNGQYDFSQIVLPGFAPALYLCGFALLINNVTGSYWAAAGIITAYWYSEFVSNGFYTRAFFLFDHSRPLPGLDPNLNRGLLLLGALVFFILNAGFSIWRRRSGAVGR